ncbi:hypothetical protein [Legionella cardiaca]|uniref:Coiled-coil protein n=1 Tax=Legionella cardiaca TaxID=1071983 RepID=A0ABY8AS25_9GAMM|nr:hypothetical protein [Legionella cardiaca]WED43470.1 hypothetical protein PXX05_01475 [Legionella cardiaca]
MPAENAKNLLIQNNKKKYEQFILNTDNTLFLPTPSSVPWIGTAGQSDAFRKKTVKHGESQVNFISKNGEAFSFQWQTTPFQLKKAVRWGIVRTESITAKVISALGHYRITAHERIAKGIISNTHALKIQFLDFYQQRFEALQELESLVNRENSLAIYNKSIERYITELQTISANLEVQFKDTQLIDINPQAISQFQADIAQDINRAKTYLTTLQEKNSNATEALLASRRARGNDSILEFVKQQMIHGLYQMQGYNQDFSFSKRRSFALTRGDLNNCIEDARKEINDHDADPRNAVRAEHHGFYSSENDTITYDFGPDNLTPARQKQVLLGISFIEGWDSVDYSNPKTPVVKNHLGSEPLTIISATNWQLHRNFTAFIKSTAYFIFNVFKGFIMPTHPWEEEAWNNKKFHLVASDLRKNASPNEPLLLKPIRFLKIMANSIKDCFKGIRNFGSELIRMPEEIFNDWNASKALKNYALVIEEAEDEMALIKEEEERRLQYLLADYPVNETSEVISILAKVDYHLTAGEKNDILTAMVSGLDGFSSVFTHNLYAKDPVGSLVFTAAYAAGAAAIFCPTVASTIFGSGYVNWFSNFSYSMGAGKLAATIAGGSTQAQVFATVWDTAIHGPNGIGATIATQIAEDPLTYGSYFAVAYGLGYVLVNGINGHEIPGLSAILKEDLGTTPEASYPFIGGKFAIGLYELLLRKPSERYEPLKIKYNGTEVAAYPESTYQIYQKIIARFNLAFWLSTHATTLPKLRPATLFEIERHIDNLFPAEEAASLKKMLYPEKEPSIAFQLFSIPLTYIPALLRLGFALIVSPIAWFMDNPNPAQPIKNAAKDLGNKIAKDLNRLLIAASHLTYVIFTVVSSPVKALALTANMIIARIASLFDWHPSYSMHQTFAMVHSFFRRVGELLYPARATKSIVTANPAHTIREMEHSYKMVLDNLKIVNTIQSELSLLQSGAAEIYHSHSPLQQTMPVGLSEKDDTIAVHSVSPSFLMS